jgi:hypothetical protein
MPKEKLHYIILNFNYPMINTFLVIFLNQNVGSILNPIRKVYLSIFEFKFYSIIKHSIRILTHHILFNKRIYYSIYKTQSYLMSNTKIYSIYKHNINIF